MKQRDVSHRNVLPDTYIPVLSKKVLANILARLPTNSLIQLVKLWPKLIRTQPHLKKGNVYSTQKELNSIVTQEARNIISGPMRSGSKKKLIDKVLFEFWSDGLNLLQISQVDCQLIVDRPNAYYWISSTVKDRGGHGNEVPISLDPPKFLHQLTRDLNELYMSYVYVCRHPTYPLVIIRIQVFDLQKISGNAVSGSRPHITSHKPYFVAIPMNSSHIIHSPGSSVISKIVLQAVERNLPQDPTNLLKLETSQTQKPVRSLDSMHILKGSSRFGNSLGVWTPYAEGKADSLPLAPTENHKLIFEETVQIQDQEKEESLDPLAKLKKIANLRFKGNVNGKIESEKLYDDLEGSTKRRKKTATYSNIESDDDDGFEEMKNSDRNEFATIVPVQYLEMILKDPIESDEGNIVMKFSGSDIFAGIHELSVRTTEQDKMVLNPAQVPGWLTGEEGANCGEIKNGKFTSL
ncbi:inner kinetochore subunit Chl4p [[Candida] anglica]|uniref:Inner kinetochore subunit Chl4p n=1 Tax=[Candida] anglica TaxID=148631 RepID=A0ABP0ECV7_9ASCO